MSDRGDLMTKFQNAILSALTEKIAEAKTEEDVRKIIERAKAFDIKKLFQDMIEMATNDTVLFMKETMFEEVMRFRADEQEFIARQERKWYRAFVASEALYIMTLEVAESYSKYVKSIKEEELSPKYWTYIVMKNIHGRALQEFLEIITLMKNGFADGAYARWRSMYELAVICSFISQHGEGVARKFYEASETDDQYDWAKESGAFPEKQKHIRFSDLRNACDISTDIWSQQYDLANKVVHASPQGTFGRLGDMGTYPVISAGRSDYGITVPGEHSAISLVQISSMFFTLFPQSDILVQLKSITQWIDVVREAYFKTHDEIFPEDEPLWSDELAQKSL